MTVSPVDETRQAIAVPPDEYAAIESAPDGLPVFKGASYQEHLDAWDQVKTGVESRLWSFAAIAASLVTKYQESTVDNFASEVRLSGRYIRGLATTYRAYQNGNRLPILSFTHHYEAAQSDNPVLAITVAHDKEMSVRELKRWVKLRKHRRPKDELESMSDEVDEAAEEFQDRDLEDESMLLADIEIALRDLGGLRRNLKSSYIIRYVSGLEDELDWELTEITKAPAKVSQRILSLVMGGCQQRDLLAKRAKLSSSDTEKFLNFWVKQGKIEQRDQGGKKEAQKGGPTRIWVPIDTPIIDFAA